MPGTHRASSTRISQSITKSHSSDLNNENLPVTSPSQPPPHFYTKAEEYWKHVPPTIDGMLGGYSSLNVPDIADSHAFLEEFGPTTTAYALDCGSGIGRITKQLLLPRFTFVDMVEVTQAFLDKAEDYIGEDFENVGELFCVGLQEFIPPRGRYDLIWIQWVIGHLTDLTLVEFLKRCINALSANGIIVVKENVIAKSPISPDTESAIFDEVDSSFTRSREALLSLFADAGLKVFGEKAQSNFPETMFPVLMFAMRPQLIPDFEPRSSP